MVQKYSKKATSPKKQKKGRKEEKLVAVGALAYRRMENDWTKGRDFSETKKSKTKENKTNITPEKNDMTSANQTLGRYKFAPLVASQL